MVSDEKKIKVSIIIPIYNVEQYLRECLNSVVNQTLKDIEIICVNDGSTDGSYEILKEYAAKDSRIMLFNQKNKGPCAARNFAIKQAKGEYLGFIDSDDWIDLNYFEKLYNEAQNNNCDIACAGLRRYKINRAPIYIKFKKIQVFHEVSDKAKAVNLPLYNYMCNKIFKRDAWFKTGIMFPEGENFEDISILLKLLYYMGDLVTVPNIYYWYRNNLNSIVNNNTQKNREDLLNAWKKLYDFADEHYIKLDKTRQFKKVEYIKIFGLTILKNIHYEERIKYYLFGKLHILTKVDTY